MYDRFKKAIPWVIVIFGIALSIYLFLRFRNAGGLAGLFTFGAVGAIDHSTRAKATAKRLNETVGEIRDSSNRIEERTVDIKETVERIDSRVTELEQLNSESRELRDRIKSTDNRLDKFLGSIKDS